MRLDWVCTPLRIFISVVVHRLEENSKPTDYKNTSRYICKTVRHLKGTFFILVKMLTVYTFYSMFLLFCVPFVISKYFLHIKEAPAGCGLKNRLRDFFYFCICNIHGIPSIFMWTKQYLTVFEIKRGRSQNMCPI